MKKLAYNTLKARVGISLLLLFSFSLLHAQQRNLNTELLVYILPDSLELPKQGKSAVTLQNAMVRSAGLTKALAETKAISIARTFPDWSEKDSTVLRNDGVPVKIPSFHRVFTLTFSTEEEANKAIELLQKQPSVLYAEKHAQVTLDNDPSYIDGTQWYLNNDGRNEGTVGADINAEGAWAIFTGSTNTTIAIIDTGVEIGHDEFTGKATGETPLGGDSHGTRVAGVAAARAMNDTGIRGVNWEAQILSKRVFDNAGNFIGSSDATEKIIEAVDEGADVLNCSWSSPDYNITLATAFAYVYKMNRVSVATMGNTWTGQVRYPGALGNVIAVGATQNNDVRSGFSTTGDHIDVVAPGGDNSGGASDIWSTTTDNGYMFTAGTSFAAPQVSGLASLLKGFQTNLSNDDIRQIIRLSAEDVNNVTLPGFDNEIGFGRINAGAALQMLQTPNQLYQWSTTGGTVHSSTGNYTQQFLSAGNLSSGNYVVKRHEVRKTITYPVPMCELAGVWGRGVGSSGWSLANPNFGEGFVEVVPGTATNTGVTLRTYVYQVWTILGQSLGYYPASPANVTFQYSVLGEPNLASTVGPITGPSLVCSSNTTFSLQNRPPGTTVTWTRSSNLTQVSGQGTNSYVVRAGNSRGNGWVRATINGPCGQVVLPQKTVWVGPPNNPTNVSVPGFYNVNPITLEKSALYTFQTYGGTGASSYSWILPSGFSFMSGQGTNGSSVKVWTPNTSGTFNLRSSPQNGCGSSGYATLSIVLPGSGGGGPAPCPNPPCSVPIPHSFPNPASEELVIDFTGANNTDQLTSIEVTISENTDAKYFAEEHTVNTQAYSESSFLPPGTMKEVFLYNDKMMLMFHTTTTDDRLSLSTARLPEGIYILHTVVGEETFRQKIMVSHK